MSDPATPVPAEEGRPEFRWQAFFQRADDPLFFLSRQRRILFVNRAWEGLTGLTGAQARGLRCSPVAPSSPSSPEVTAHALCPPPEVMTGERATTRRPAPRDPSEWWVIDFLPFKKDRHVLGILGRVGRQAASTTAESITLPHKLLDLRERVLGRHSLDRLSSTVPAMNRVITQARLAIQVRAPILIRGDQGTGKEWLARAIHGQSTARQGAFVSLDCARLSASTLHRFLTVEGPVSPWSRAGVLYLREPASLPRELQQRVVDFARDETNVAGPRLIAGSRTDLGTAAGQETAIEELHIVFSALVIPLPSLRERAPDLPRIVNELLAFIAVRLGRTAATLTPAAWDLVRSHSWPGNWTELLQVLRAASLRADLDKIEDRHLPRYLRRTVTLERMSGERSDRPLPLDQLLEEAERRLILQALRRAAGNRSKAAEILAVWRARLLRRMEALGISDADWQRA